MQTAHELFLYGLGDILDGERQLLEALGKQANEVSNQQLKKAIELHRAQTGKQVQRLEQCFEELGEQPQESECVGIKGLVEEYENFVDEDPAGDILDLETTVAASKVERYEITEYEALIRLAEMMGHTKPARLLQQNLAEEEQTLEKMQDFSKELKPKNMGMEDVETLEEEQEERPQRARSSKSRGARTRRIA